MKTLKEFQNHTVKFIFCDIDDTLTNEGKLPANSYQALWNLKNAGYIVIPITGRPAGWCEMIARFWPVSAVIGENGALYYKYENKKMKRHYAVKESQIAKNRKKLNQLSKKIIKTVKGSAVSTDQFCRVFDLAIDFCEDVKPLSKEKVQKIVNLFEKAGATAKVSSIHVNGWFGKYDKLTMCKTFMKKEFKIDIQKQNEMCAFIGDSPNDEPMFAFFKNSFAVQNIQNFLEDLKHKPQFITTSRGADGFVEFSQRF